MVQYFAAYLDSAFAALSDPTRRGVLEQLGRADAPITDLADKFYMTLTGMKKRVGGRYRFEFGREAAKPMVFFGRYLEVAPHSRLVWINDEGDDGAVTTVTFEENAGRTLLVMHELHPSKEALDGAIAGMEGGMRDTFAQLDELLVTLGVSAERSLSRRLGRQSRLVELNKSPLYSCHPRAPVTWLDRPCQKKAPVRGLSVAWVRAHESFGSTVVAA